MELIESSLRHGVSSSQVMSSWQELTRPPFICFISLVKDFLELVCARGPLCPATRLSIADRLLHSSIWNIVP